MTPSPRHDAASLHAGWHLAVRAALASSLLMVTLAYALRRFLDLDGRYIVGLAVMTGLFLGLHLPAARPPRPAVARVRLHR
jgi:hypothetical protein